jgi:hypothetical protein
MIHCSVADHIAEIRIDHPPVNGLGVAMIDDLIAALGRAAAADDVRVVLITSAVPRRFCAGLDLAAVLNDVSALRSLVDKLYVRLSDAQQALGRPSIAVVNGAARGGGMTLAISCDVVIAGAGATFGYPEIDVGLLPAIHFVQLPRVVGRHRAFDLRSVFHFRSPATHLCRAYSFSWPLPPSASAPASAPAASKATSQKPNHKQKQDGADGSVDDRGDNTGTEVDADLRQQPVANECADNAYYEIADESESRAPYDLSGQPTSNKTDKQYDQKTFI